VRELVPEMDGIAEFAERHETQPLVIFGEDESFAASGDGVAIAFFDGFGSFAAGDVEVLCEDGEIGAGGEADEVDGVRAGEDFVEIVDAPDEAAFEVAPSTKIFDVEIADGEETRSFGEAGADFRPELEPTVERGAEEGEGVFGHGLMLEEQVFFDDGELAGEPLFEGGGGGEDGLISAGHEVFLQRSNSFVDRWSMANEIKPGSFATLRMTPFTES